MLLPHHNDLDVPLFFGNALLTFMSESDIICQMKGCIFVIIGWQMLRSTSQSRRFKWFMLIGIFYAMTATILGAFAAHALRTQFSDYQMHIFQTGIFYQFIHSLALLFVGLILWQSNTRILQVSGWLFIAGILLFSGSLYLLSLMQIKAIGVVTPFGGVCFIFGWLLLAVGIYKNVS